MKEGPKRPEHGANWVINRLHHVLSPQGGARSRVVNLDVRIDTCVSWADNSVVDSDSK